jgi:hypothetical protein
MRALALVVTGFLGQAVVHSLVRTVVEDALFVLVDFPLLRGPDVGREAHAPVPLLGLCWRRVTLRGRRSAVSPRALRRSLLVILSRPVWIPMRVPPSIIASARYGIAVPVLIKEAARPLVVVAPRGARLIVPVTVVECSGFVIGASRRSRILRRISVPIAIVAVASVVVVPS